MHDVSVAVPAPTIAAPVETKPLLPQLRICCKRCPRPAAVIVAGLRLCGSCFFAYSKRMESADSGA